MDFAPLPPLELLEDDELDSAFAFAAGFLAAGLALAAGFAACAEEHGRSIIAGSISAGRMMRVVDHKLGRLLIMAGLSNAKVTGGSSTAGCDFVLTS